MQTTESFDSLGLTEPLQRALRELRYVEPTPIQAQAIPPLLSGKDLLGTAQTGTGKTAAFTLPILHRMLERPRKPTKSRFRCLVLTPTRELAVQVSESFQRYGKHLRLRTGLVYGGVGAQPQIRDLRKGLDVLIATPGRLLDLYRQGHLDFQGTEFFVLDEADRMLDMGFIPDIRKVVEQLPSQRQSLFFSATFSGEMEHLAGSILSAPVEVRIAPKEKTAANIDHRLCFVRRERKNRLLDDLLEEQKTTKGNNLTLIFNRTKHGADKLAKQLARSGVRAESIHGNKSQRARQLALNNFRNGTSPVLVATDVAARGIDVRDITLVVNYDLPNEPEAYIHRIGRTARAGAKGRALSFCSEESLSELQAIEKLIRNEIAVHRDHAFHEEGLRSRRAKPCNDKARSPKGRGKPSRGNRARPLKRSRGFAPRS